MTPIADMVERMLRDDVSHETIVLAIRTVETASVTHNVTQRHAQRDVTLSPGAVRSRKWREKNKQNKGLAEANDAALQPDQPVTPQRHAQRHSVTPPCDLSSFLPLGNGFQQEEKKKEVTTRAKGTRLSRDTPMTDADWQFALEHGLDPETAWAEFIDYWIGVPGSRGVKLDWAATWRNRVRMISKKTGGKVERSGKNRTSPSAGSRTFAQDAIVTGMAAALSERPDSRLGNGRARGRGEGEQDYPNDNEVIGTVPLGVPFD